MIALNFMVSGVNKAYNEFQENQVSLIIFILILGINFLLNIADQAVTPIGSFLMIMTTLLVPIILLFTLFRPIYGFLYDREQCIKEFYAGVEKEISESSSGAVLWSKKTSSSSSSV